MIHPTVIGMILRTQHQIDRAREIETISDLCYFQSGNDHIEVGNLEKTFGELEFYVPLEFELLLTYIARGKMGKARLAKLKEDLYYAWRVSRNVSPLSRI